MTVERVARDVGDEIEGLAEDEMGEPKNVLQLSPIKGGEEGKEREGRGREKNDQWVGKGPQSSARTLSPLMGLNRGYIGPK